jgi:probable lipoprotein NlpC
MLSVRSPQIRILFFYLLIPILYVSRLHAAPLETGFALAPPESASAVEKDAAYHNARVQVLATAEKYEKTPYRYGGVDRKGLDCSGLIYVSFHEALGITIPHNAEGLYSWVEKTQIERAQPGDLVFFNTTGNGKISHVGIYTGDGRFIHAASEGPVTGVIYSSLDEQYWSRTYAGVGRALPASNVGSGRRDTAHPQEGGGGTSVTAAHTPQSRKENPTGNFLIGFAIAPSWNTYYTGDTIFRGAAGQFRLGAEVKLFGKPMIFGTELRSEWDGALGVFRMPLTLSWGFNDNLRIFAGPVLSFGDAALDVSGEDRQYTRGTTWFGAAGVTIAPFTFKIAGSELAPYGELAWQSYVSNNSGKNFGADFAAGFRFSTGIRCTWRAW